MNQLFSRCTAKGFKPDDIEKCLEEYERLDVWQLNQAKTKLTIVNWVKNEGDENQVQHDTCMYLIWRIVQVNFTRWIQIVLQMLTLSMMTS